MSGLSESLLEYPMMRLRLKWDRIFILIFGIIALLIACTLLFFKAGVAPSPSYSIAKDYSWYPPELQDKASSMNAFSNELLEAIAREEGIKITLWTAHSPTLESELNSGDYDAILTAIRPSQMHREKFEFSDSLYALGPVLVVKEDSHIPSLQQMEGKTVGILAESFLSFNINQYPSLMLKTYHSPQQALSALDRDQVDGVLMDFLPAHLYITGAFAGRLKIATPPLNESGLRIVAKKNKPGADLVEHFNKGLRTLKNNGKYEKLLRKWGFYPEIEQEEKVKSTFGWELFIESI